MPDYSAPFNQDRANGRRRTRIKKNPANPASKITDAEFMIIGSVAALADLLGPFGFPCVIVLCIWSAIKFQKFPTKKIIAAGSSEVLSLGLLPGWTGYVLYLFLEQKGYLPKWLAKRRSKLSKLRI